MVLTFLMDYFAVKIEEAFSSETSLNILSRVLVTIDGVIIGNWVY
jgi:hypothetical protein